MAAVSRYFLMASAAAGGGGSVSAAGAGCAKGPSREAANDHLGESAALAALGQ